MKVYIYGGPKTHAEGQHDYPQFIADWSKILQNRGANVDGGLHFPTARELTGVDVLVIYKGDAGYVSLEDRATLDQFLRRGGGIISLHDALCADDTEYFANIVGGAKRARPDELHPRSQRALHDRRQGAPDHEGHGGLQDHGRGLLPHDVVEDAGDPRPRDSRDRRDPERRDPQGRGRAADVDVREVARARAGRLAVSRVRLDAGPQLLELRAAERPADAASGDRVGRQAADRHADDRASAAGQR